MLDKLSSGLKESMKKLMSSKYATKELIKSVVKDIQKSLIQSDVDVRLVLDLTKRIKKKALDSTQEGLTKKEEVIKIVYDELVEFVGEGGELDIKETPYKILLVGLFGNGKTTTTAKLAKYYKKKGYKVALVQTDTYRPAAYKQLEQLVENLNIPVYGQEDNDKKDASQLFLEYEDKLNNYDIVLVDSAGRDALNDELIDEISNLNDVVMPNQTLLTMSADIGQSAKEQATAFKESTSVSGVIITRMDGSAKGGGALTACSVADVPVRFLGTGEKIDDLEVFEPVNFISRLIGFGDLDSLLEKAKESISEDRAEELSRRLMEGKFNLIDFYEQMQAMKNLGPMKKVMNMIPGLSMANIPGNILEQEEKKLDYWKFAMQSMTEYELKNPKRIRDSRLERISEGSGVSKKTIRELLRMFRQMKKMTKNLKGNKGDMKKMMKNFKGMPMDKMMNQMKNMNFK